jgi:hypothetical protein
MKVTFSQGSYKQNINVSVDETHKITIPYSEDKSIIGYIRQVPGLNDIESLDEVSFFFQWGETEKEETIISFIQATEKTIAINYLSLYWNSVNHKRLWKFKLFMDGSISCKEISCCILGNISDFVLYDWNEVRIMWSESIDSLYIWNSFEKFTINIPFIKKMRVFTQDTGNSIKQFNILSTNISKIEITWTENLEIGEFLFENSEMLWGILSNITFRKIYFLNSILQNINFYNIIFPTEVQDFLISKTTFIKTSFASVKWWNYFWLEAEIYKLFSDKKRVVSVDEIEMKEVHRMLKHSHDEIWNKTEANKFFAKEMEYHMKVLAKDPEKKWEYRITWLQKQVSDFGQDWTRAFWVYIGLIFIGFISYQVYQVSDPKLIFDYSYEGFKNWVVDFTKLANPLPKVEDINNPFSLLFSITKILIVYQIVVALRRISQR